MRFRNREHSSSRNRRITSKTSLHTSLLGHPRDKQRCRFTAQYHGILHDAPAHFSGAHKHASQPTERTSITAQQHRRNRSDLTSALLGASMPLGSSAFLCLFVVDRMMAVASTSSNDGSEAAATRIGEPLKVPFLSLAVNADNSFAVRERGPLGGYGPDTVKHTKAHTHTRTHNPKLAAHKP